jgi:ferredoxin
MRRKWHNSVRFAVAVVFMITAAFCIIIAPETAAGFLMFQPGPTWVKLATGGAVSGVALTVGFLLPTFLFGRFFCAVFCPLGTAQDVIGAFRPRRRTTLHNFQAVRYGVAALSLSLLAGGWAVAFRYLDPFSRFTAFVAAGKSIAGADSAPFVYGSMAGGIVPAVALAALALWKKRVFCVSLCPVGTVLGLFSRFALHRMRLRDSCSGCGVCAAACPTGCINNGVREIDGERCVLCLRCVSICPIGSVSYTRQRNRYHGNAVAVDASRRRFLMAGAILSAGMVGAGLRLSGAIRGLARAAENPDGLILPPGAVDADRFARRCTGCQLCAAACPVGVITPAPHGFGPVRLDYAGSGCAYDCARCGAVCPSGALHRLELADKQWLKIGEATLDKQKCRITRENAACDLCVKACPKGAILLFDGPGGLRMPEVAAFHCIGCGACQAACPERFAAIAVSPVEQRPMGMDF